MLEKVAQIRKEILSVVMETTGTDFTSYKESTVLRRLNKRMEALGVADLGSYLTYIREHQAEPEALMRFILIGVTSFFRDKAAFQHLKDYLVQRIESKSDGEELRIWVPGCAEGKEAYSIALMVYKILEEKDLQLPVKIFATDLNEVFIRQARSAVYAKEDIEEVPQHLREKYFAPVDGQLFELQKEVRQMVIFSMHDLTSSPPFLRLDLISCRNLLIYFTSELQDRVFPLFHYALQPQGFLFIGQSESVSRFSDLFDPVEPKYRIYQKKNGGRRYRIDLNLQRPGRARAHSHGPSRSKQNDGLRQRIKDSLYHYDDRPFAIVNECLDLIEIHGQITPFVRLNPGNFDVNILSLVPQALVMPLRKTVLDAIGRKDRSVSPHVKISVDGIHYEVCLSVFPVLGEGEGEGLYMVTFNSQESRADPARQGAPVTDDRSARILDLEHELAASHEHLQSYTEEIETGNEEMQSLNEELVSVNGELSFANLELEKKNRELSGLNSTLQEASKRAEIARRELEAKDTALLATEARLRAMLDNGPQATWLLNPDYTIAESNRAAKVLAVDFFGKEIMPGDNALSYLPKDGIGSFKEIFSIAMQGSLSTGVRETEGEGCIFSYSRYQFIPVVQGDKVVQVVYSSSDVSQELRDRAELANSERLLEAVFDTALVGLCMIDEQGRLVRANPAYCKMYGYEVGDLLGRQFIELILPDLREFAMNAHRSVMSSGKPMEGTSRAMASDGAIVDIRVRSSRFKDGETFYRVAAVANITKEIRSAAKLAKKQEDLNEAQRLAQIGNWSYNIKKKALKGSQEVYRQLEVAPNVSDFRKLAKSRIAETDLHRLRMAVKEAIKTKTAFDVDISLSLPGGRERHLNLIGKGHYDDEGNIIRVIGTNLDITQRKEYEEQIRQSEHSLNEAQALGRMGSWSHDLITGKIHWSDELIRMAMKKPEDGLPKLTELKKNIHPDDWLELSIRTQNVKETGEGFSMNIRNAPGIGKMNHGLYMVTGVKDKSGKVVKIYSILQDITERLEMEQKLQASISQLADYQKALDISSILCILDSEGNFIDVNANFLQLCGYKESDLIGEHLSKLIETDDLSELLRDMDHWRGELRLHSGDHTHHWIDTAIVPFFDGAGNTYQYMVIANEITEQRLANDRIRASEQNLNTAQRIAKLGNWEYDLADRKVLSWSTHMNELLDWDPDRRRPKIEEFFQFMDGVSRQELIDYLEKACKDGNRKELDVKIVTAKGDTKFIQVTCEPIVGEDGNCTSVKGITMDITQRKTAEQGLKQSLKELSDFKAALDVSSIVDITDKEGAFVYVNDNFCTLTGFSRQELLGNTYRLVNSGNHGEEFFRDMWDVLLRGQIWKGAVNNVSSTGKNLWMETTIVPFLDSKGLPFQYLCIRTDITEKRMAEDRVRENEQLLRSVNTNITDAIYRSDGENEVIYANEAFIRMFGFDSFEDMTNTKGRVISMNQQKVESLVEKMRKNGQIGNEEVLFRRKDGSTFWGLWSCLYNTEDSKVSYDGAIKDITDRKLQEDELRKKNAMLEKTNRELDRFVYSASHNLRAPLSSILGLISISKMENMESQYLDMMERSVHKMDSFIREVVDYSRNTRVDIVAEDIDLEEVVRDSFEQLRFMKNADRIELAVTRHGERAFSSDLSRIKLLIENLISNAVKYHDMGKPQPLVKVRIKISRIAAKITVTDNGLGIPEEHHAKLFQMFYRATDVNEGSGLGLFIVKEVLDKLQGKITMTSKLKEGTTFTVTLPNLA